MASHWSAKVSFSKFTGFFSHDCCGKSWNGRSSISLRNGEEFCCFVFWAWLFHIGAWLNFFSSACFVQLHLTRQLRWSLWAISSWCRDGFSCAVTMGQKIGFGLLCHPSAADYLHQVWQAESDGLNGFCVTDPQEPEFPQPIRRTWRRQRRCSSPGWSTVPPAKAGTCSPGSWLLLWAKQCRPAPMRAQ